jgi:hypothetical protein
MTNEERDLITRFIERVGGAQSGGFAPGTGQAGALPPVDREADSLIADLFNRYPEARYRITQTAFVQEHALVAAQNRIQQLEWELQQARQAQAAAQPQGASPWGQPPQQPASRGFFGGLFGGGSRQAQPQYGQPQYAQPQYGQAQYAPPPPQYAPGYSPGMFQQRGSGFLGSALTTAAGVAGGMVAGNALMNLFSGSHGDAASAATSTAGQFIPVPSASPWSASPLAGPAGSPYDVGGADKGVADTTGWTNADQGGWQQPAADTGGWDNQQSADTGGWSDPGTDVSDAGGGGDDWT